MVKLQKHFSYEYKDRKHYKYIITIPSIMVEQMGWEPGNELDLNVQGDALILQSNDSTQKASNSITEGK